MAVTIMVVEDEAEIRDLVAAALAAEGFEVLCAGDADEALQLLDANPAVDLVFTDIVMPGDHHGYDLAREVRARHPGIKLLYTSGYALGTALRQSAPIEPAGLVAKPYRLEQLVGEIRRALAA
ncbi:MAG TPA: response regulator [Candidatus Sulfotelmatobacter sp.]|nr:response regulator [Candidatus Sulfotelmatobacter sp.]